MKWSSQCTGFLLMLMPAEVWSSAVESAKHWGVLLLCRSALGHPAIYLYVVCHFYFSKHFHFGIISLTVDHRKFKLGVISQSGFSIYFSCYSTTLKLISSLECGNGTENTRIRRLRGVVQYFYLYSLSVLCINVILHSFDIMYKLASWTWLKY